MIRLALMLASLLVASAAHAGNGDSQMTVGQEPQPKPAAQRPWRPYWPHLPRTTRDKERCEQDRLITKDDPCSDNRVIERDGKKTN
jgi:hypothetical protein